MKIMFGRSINRKLYTARLLSSLIFLFVSCSKNEDIDPVVARTVMVYMSANNNLASEALDNINQMEAGFGEFDGKLIVYAKVFGQLPKIYEIVKDDSPQIVSKVLKSYSDHNASDPTIMKMVFEDMENLAKADSYAAILWSHATNWYPGNEKMGKVKSFGEDGGKTMDILDLKNALPKNLDFLIFDACSMASVEVLYELKNVVPLVLASPTEVISVGMPYDKIVPYLFLNDSKNGLKKAAELYFEFYNNQQGKLRSASFSLIDLKEMDNLAQSMREIIDNNPKVRVNRNGIQRLNLDITAVKTVPAYDLLDFCAKNFPKEDLDKIKEQVGKTVLFKVHTEQFLGTPILTFSGLSCYIPIEAESNFYKYYQSLEWSKRSSYFKLFYWIS